MSRATMWTLAWPCLPVLEVDISTILQGRPRRGGQAQEAVRSDLRPPPPGPGQDAHRRRQRHLVVRRRPQRDQLLDAALLRLPDPRHRQRAPVALQVPLGPRPAEPPQEEDHGSPGQETFKDSLDVKGGYSE